MIVRESVANYGLLEDVAGAVAPVAVPLSSGRLAQAKRSYVTRRIELDEAAQLLVADVRPRAGDLLLARIDRLGHHRRLESPEGRRCQLFPGDEVLLCYGARYASDQFEALVPECLEPCDMVAAGGIAAHCVHRHGAARQPTRIEPIGLVADATGQPLNLDRYALRSEPSARGRPPVLAVVGTGMNAGKTTTAASLVHGLSRSGLTVVVGKVTGTGAGGDRWAYVDAGAASVLDFSDFGYASTYGVSSVDVASLLGRMVDVLAAQSPDAIVIEVADGLFFADTANLIRSAAFRALVDDVVLAAGDAMGAVEAMRCLSDSAVVPAAVAGLLTSSPLAMREAAQMIDLPIVTLNMLADGHWTPPRLAAPARLSA